MFFAGCFGGKHDVRGVTPQTLAHPVEKMSIKPESVVFLKKPIYLILFMIFITGCMFIVLRNNYSLDEIEHNTVQHVLAHQAEIESIALQMFEEQVPGQERTYNGWKATWFSFPEKYVEFNIASRGFASESTAIYVRYFPDDSPPNIEKYKLIDDELYWEDPDRDNWEKAKKITSNLYYFECHF